MTTQRLSRATVGLGKLALAAVALMLAAAAFGLQASGQTDQPAPRPAAKTSIAGPFVHENLAVYVIRGTSSDSRAYITLDQGLAAGTVHVREKGATTGQDQSTVNTLEIENKSNMWLFLHAGDVVKGGKQDRTIMTDLVLAPNSKPQPVDAFCVERGRWTPSQSGLAFKSNTGIVAGGSLKRAIQSEKNQSRVWEEVAKAEKRAAGARVTTAVASPAPLSSTGTYNAITQDRIVSGGRDGYVKALLPSLRNFPDAIGIAVAINGKVTAADQYASASLFRALSGKLLESYALEAFLAREPGRQPAPAKEQMSAFLAKSAAAPAKSEQIGESMHQATRDTADAVVYEYGHVTGRNGRRDVTVLHKSYLKK